MIIDKLSYRDIVRILTPQGYRLLLEMGGVMLALHDNKEWIVARFGVKGKYHFIMEEYTDALRVPHKAWREAMKREPITAIAS